MTTINLRDGLEALYYFGEQDFDPRRNLLQDHSGYGLHASAKGGITIPSDDGSGNEVGANGPNDFEATSFDGGDDRFNIPSLSFNDGEPWSVSVICLKNVSSDDDRAYVLDSGKNYEKGTVHVQGSGDQAGYKTNENGNNLYSPQTNSGGVNHFFNVQTDGSHFQCTSSVLGSDLLTNFHDDMDYNTETTWYNIGSATGAASRKWFIGNMSILMVHSRELSHQEKEHINNFTAPRRSML